VGLPLRGGLWRWGDAGVKGGAGVRRRVELGGGGRGGVEWYILGVWGVGWGAEREEVRGREGKLDVWSRKWGGILETSGKCKGRILVGTQIYPCANQQWIKVA